MYMLSSLLVFLHNISQYTLIKVKVKVKAKVRLSLCLFLTEHRVMKAYWGVKVWLHSFFNLCTRWRWVVSFTPRPLYPQRKSPRYPLDWIKTNDCLSAIIMRGGGKLMTVIYTKIQAMDINSSRCNKLKRVLFVFQNSFNISHNAFA
jgi:hypothetical protein